MILLWGIPTDGPLESVHAALMRMRAPVAFLDQYTALRSRLELTIGDGEAHGTLATGQWSADLASFTAVYLRPYDVRRICALQGRKRNGRSFHDALRFEDALTCWMEMAPALVINRPSAMASNNSKPYQLELIRMAGFDVPDTLVTTDPAAAVDFWEQHGAVIYKSISGVRSIVTRVGPEHRDRLQDIAHCPTQFQERIEGTDVRVHVVGDEVFGCEICSDADDYRYPRRQGADVRVRGCAVPEELADRCRQLAKALKLPVVGIDLRRTAAGKWYCFEANPSPGFTFYQEATGQPIGEAVARLLMRADRATAR